MSEFDLNKAKIKTGFSIPENYFEQFEIKMQEKLFHEKETKVVSIFHKKSVWISSIAAVLVLCVAIPSYFNSTTTAKLESTTIENYLSYQTNFTNYDIIENLSNKDIIELENSFAMNDDGVENYLLETQNLEYYLNE